MRLYFAVNDLIAHDRNLVRDPALRLPSSRLLSRDECLALNPSIDPTDVTGGIEWYDCQMYNSVRDLGRRGEVPSRRRPGVPAG